MTTYNQRFVLVECPADENEVNGLSVQMTQDMGLKGWQLISTAFVPNPGGVPLLLLAFQK